MEFQKELDFRTDYKEISASRSILPDYLLLSYHQHISLSGYLPSVTNQPDESNEEYLSAIRRFPICHNYSTWLHKERMLHFFLCRLHNAEGILL